MSCQTGRFSACCCVEHRGSGRLACREDPALWRIVAALIGMQNSYLAMQGPPATGKTHPGSRVIRELVEKHHWSVGAVAQSHAVVASGLDASLIGKSDSQAIDRRWIEIKDDARSRARFLQEH